MIRITLSILCLILAVGCIDGPTGYESNNWLGCFLFAITGIVLGIWALMTDKTLTENN
jgi:hypothetical protein|tara:strand:+ start:185 stop:358 length:174 start_codon:yes stop_codon:yes gene_type:complete